MKSTLALVFLFGISASSASYLNRENAYNDLQTLPKSSRAVTTLNQDFNDIIALIPTATIKSTIENFAQNDRQVQAVVKFCQTLPFRQAVERIVFMPDIKKFLQYLRNEGVAVDSALVQFWIWFQNVPTGTSAATGKEGVQSLLATVKGLVANQQVLNKVLSKLMTSPKFYQFYRVLRSANTRRAVDGILARPDVQWGINELETMGVGVRKALQELYLQLGWGSRLF